MASRPATAPAPASAVAAAKPPADDFTILIAGGGVAALEAILSLRHSGCEAHIDLVCPNREFSLRQLSTGQPFGAPPSRTLDLAAFCERMGVRLRPDKLAEVWGGSQRALLD